MKLSDFYEMHAAAVEAGLDCVPMTRSELFEYEALLTLEFDQPMLLGLPIWVVDAVPT